MCKPHYNCWYPSQCECTLAMPLIKAQLSDVIWCKFIIYLVRSNNEWWSSIALRPMNSPAMQLGIVYNISSSSILAGESQLGLSQLCFLICTSKSTGINISFVFSEVYVGLTSFYYVLFLKLTFRSESCTLINDRACFSPSIKIIHTAVSYHTCKESANLLPMILL